MDNIFVLLKLFLGFQIIFCSQKREIVYILYIFKNLNNEKGPN